MRLQSIPMVYDADVSSAHLPAVIQGLTPDDVMPPAPPRGKAPSDAGAAGGGGGGGTDPTAAAHYARVVAGILYVACGGLDQAHNLVTPLCWGASTPYAGRPVPASPAAQDAAYVHALVHRAEGLCDGEFGTGFSNANYWYKATGPHPVQEEVLAAMRRRAAGDERLSRLAAAHGERFEPGRWVAACEQAAAVAAAKGARGGGGGGGDPALVAWVEGVGSDEWRALLRHCYGRLRQAAAA